MILFVEVLNSFIVCFVSCWSICLLSDLLFKVQNCLNFCNNIHICFKYVDQVMMNNHRNYKSGYEFNYNSTFPRIPPNSKLHRMILNVLNVLPSEESSSVLLINNAIVPVKQEIVIRRGRKDQIIRSVWTSPDFKHNILRKSRLQKAYYVQGSDQIKCIPIFKVFL